MAFLFFSGKEELSPADELLGERGEGDVGDKSTGDEGDEEGERGGEERGDNDGTGDSELPRANLKSLGSGPGRLLARMLLRAASDAARLPGR